MLIPKAQLNTQKGEEAKQLSKEGERKAGQAVDLDVEEERHGGPGVLLDEVEPDGGLVGDVLDHPVHAVLHCTTSTRPPKNDAVSEVLDGNPQRRRENENRAEGNWSPRLPRRKPSAGESGNDDPAAAEEEEEEGRWCMSAPAGGRPSRTRRLRSSRSSQIRRRSERKQLRKRSIWEPLSVY